MPNPKTIVINTGPILALVAALGDLTVLRSIYQQVYVPFEVSQEVLTGGKAGFGVAQFEQADWLIKWPQSIEIEAILANSLDVGEASVIQLALNEKINTVCIDEATGRRVARLSGLSLTGSVGILLRAKKEGYPVSMEQAIRRMMAHGIWLSDGVIAFALTQAGENRR